LYLAKQDTSFKDEEIYILKKTLCKLD
jgi:hypothetical protein